MSSSVDLSGKIILVTGASRGIGRAVALAAARAGADIIITHGGSAGTFFDKTSMENSLDGIPETDHASKEW